MQRIPNLLSHLLNLVIVLGIVGLLQVALAQNSGPAQDATHQGNVTTEPSRIATRPLAGSPEQKDAKTVHISKDPAEMAASNVDLQPGDTVVVPKVGIVYVLGEVTRPDVARNSVES